MEKLKVAAFSLLCLFLAACGNEFARQEYGSNEKIAQMADHYAKEGSVGRSIDGGDALTISKFNGRETLWDETIQENQDMELDVSLYISKGQAKVVHIDSDGNVTTVVECSPKDSEDGVVTKTVSLKSGQNRLKIVGYDCEEVDLKVLVAEPQA